MSVTQTSVVAGGSFLIQELPYDNLLTPDDLDEEHRMIRQTAERFMLERVMPNLEKVEHKEKGLLPQLIREAAELGLVGAEIPEQYGGMGLDLLCTMLITEETIAFENPESSTTLPNIAPSRNTGK